MKLRSSDGSEFEMAIAGHQFPVIETADEDANWLLIRTTVAHPRGRWTSQDPSLLTWEIQRLADWLEEVARGESVESEQDFIEPNLSFCLHGDSERRVLRVYFELESRPPWAGYSTAGQRDVWVEFPLAEINLAAAARSLREQLSRYPQRGPRYR